MQRQIETSRIFVCSGCMLERLCVIHTMNICPDATNSQEMKLLLMSKEKTVKGTQTISGREGGEGISREQVTAFSDQSSIVMSLTSTFPPDICHCFSSVHASHYQNKYSFRSPKYLYVKDRLELKRRTAAVWKVPSWEIAGTFLPHSCLLIYYQPSFSLAGYN